MSERNPKTDIRNRQQPGDSRLVFRTFLDRLLIFIFSFLSLLSLRAADAPPAPAVIPGSTPAVDTVERDFENLMDLDDLVAEEIEQWQQSALTNRFGNDAVQQAALNLKVKQRLETVNQAYAKFLSEHPRHFKARMTYGSFLSESGRETEALKQWEEARQLCPTNAAVWNNLGNYYGHNGPSTNAFACYRRAIELDPKQPLYYHNLARNIYIYQDTAADYFRLKPREVLAKAQELYRKTLDLNPTNFMAASDLAQSYYAIHLPLSGKKADDLIAAQKLTDEALAAWKTALKLARDETERQGVFLHMARVQISAGRYREARENLAAVNDPALASTKVELETRLEKETGRAILPR